MCLALTSLSSAHRSTPLPHAGAPSASEQGSHLLPVSSLLQLQVCKLQDQIALLNLVQADEVSFHTLLKVYDYAGEVDGALKVII